MRLTGLLLSVGMHLAIVLAITLKLVPEFVRTDAPVMEILPIELMTLADTTNLTPVAEKGPLDNEDKAIDAPKEEFTPAEAAPAAVAEEAVAVPDPAAKPEPKPTPTPAPTPTPKATPSNKPADTKTADAKPKAPPTKTLNQILADARARAATTGGSQDQNAKTSSEAPRRGIGNQQTNTATLAQFVFQEMVNRNCWRDSSDMPDASRLAAVIRITFKRGGMFDGEPTLVQPSRPPTNDIPLQTFISRTFAALKRCEPFQTIPQQYYDNPQYIDAEFRATKQARR